MNFVAVIIQSYVPIVRLTHIRWRLMRFSFTQRICSYRRPCSWWTEEAPGGHQHSTKSLPCSLWQLHRGGLIFLLAKKSGVPREHEVDFSRSSLLKMVKVLPSQQCLTRDLPPVALGFRSPLGIRRASVKENLRVQVRDVWRTSSFGPSLSALPRSRREDQDGLSRTKERKRKTERRGESVTLYSQIHLCHVGCSVLSSQQIWLFWMVLLWVDNRQSPDR